MEVVTTQIVVPLSMVDTHVFVSFLYDASPQYAAAQALLNQARQSDARLCMTPQVMVGGTFFDSLTRRSTTLKHLRGAA
jgi:predicted nucleic acid-binding protein